MPITCFSLTSNLKLVYQLNEFFFNQILWIRFVWNYQSTSHILYVLSKSQLWHVRKKIDCRGIKEFSYLQFLLKNGYIYLLYIPQLYKIEYQLRKQREKERRRYLSQMTCIVPPVFRPPPDPGFPSPFPPYPPGIIGGDFDLFPQFLGMSMKIVL